MVKSITGLLIGIAIADARIKSVDDKSEAYVPGFKGQRIWRHRDPRSPAHVVQASSSARSRTWTRPNRLWRDMVSGSARDHRQHHAVNRRIAPRDALLTTPASSLMCSRRGALRHRQIIVRLPAGKNLAADRRGGRCKWLLDAEGYELAHFGFNAVPRDYARLGRLLSSMTARGTASRSFRHHGMIDGDDNAPADSYLAPGRSSSDPLGYGYLIWLAAAGRGASSRCALLQPAGFWSIRHQSS